MLKKVKNEILFTKNEMIYIQQGLIQRADELHKKKVKDSFWESLDYQEDIDALFEVKKLFVLNSKKHYEGYY